MNKSEINPFLLDKPITTLMSLGNYTSGDIEKGLHNFQKPFLMDSDKPTKLYKIYNFEETVYSFSTATFKLFFFIIFHLRHPSDSIELNPKSFEQATGLKLSSFNHARGELKKKKIIAKKKGRKNMYWVNPLFIFSGNRPKYIEERYGSEYLVDVKSKEYYELKSKEVDEF